MKKRVLNKSPREEYVLSAHVCEPQESYCYIGMISTGGSPAILTRAYATDGTDLWGFKHLKYPRKQDLTFACKTHVGSVRKAVTYSREVFQFDSLHEFLVWAAEVESKRDGNHDC